MLRCAKSKFFLRPVRPTQATPLPYRAAPSPLPLNPTSCTIHDAVSGCVIAKIGTTPSRLAQEGSPGACGRCISGGMQQCVSANGYRCQTKLSHVTLLIRQCHVINTPRAVCFVLKLAQASLGLQIEGSECFDVQNRSFSFDQSRCAPPSPSPGPSPGRPMPPSPQSTFSLPPNTCINDTVSCCVLSKIIGTTPSPLAQEGSPAGASVAGCNGLCQQTATGAKRSFLMSCF